MTIAAQSGPLVTYNSNPLGSVGTGSANQNPEAGPSMFMHGASLLDPRTPFTYKPGQAFGSATYGWYSGFCQLINQVPSTIAANNIAAAQAVTAGTAMTLVSSSAAGITVGVSITNAVSGATVTGLLAIDGAMAGYPFGQAQTVNMWDPTKAISRNVRVTTNADDTGGLYTVVGYDLYGYPMSEAITGVSSGVASGKKAFKYITSVTPSGTINSTSVIVGTGDVIGLPLRTDYVGQLLINYNSTLVTAGTGFVAAVTTSPATTTTGDVRGTYALQSASDGTKRLVVYLMPTVADAASVTGLVGVAQNLSSTNGG